MRGIISLAGINDLRGYGRGCGNAVSKLLGGPPEEIGHKVAAALVGTFLGILLCYGLIGPVSQNMAKAADDEHAYYQVLRVALIAFVKGLSPVLAIEMAQLKMKPRDA